MFKIQNRVFLSFLLFFLIQSVYANPNADRAAVQKEYRDWCAAISKAKGDPEVMVKFYAPDAILLPTFYPKILINAHGGLNAYFTEFTNSPNIECIPDTLKTQLYNDVAINSGFYTFTYTEKDGKTKTVPARFTFVYELIDKQWLIIEHHSSLRPLK